jgi:hypothetical protein
MTELIDLQNDAKKMQDNVSRLMEWWKEQKRGKDDGGVEGADWIEAFDHMVEAGDHEAAIRWLAFHSDGFITQLKHFIDEVQGISRQADELLYSPEGQLN